MTKQITHQLTSLIQTGMLTAGELLPSERNLADSLGVARNVVRRSYEYLSNGGHIEGRGRGGKRVSSASGAGKGAATKAQKSSTAKRKVSGGSAKAKSSRKAR